MSSSRALAPGFRFHPTDEELVGYYLKRKIANKPLHVDAISTVDLYRTEPWDLPIKSKIQSRDTEWYFFGALDRKYSNRSRTNRATGSGYWKTTGKDRPVWCGGRVRGMKKTLVFHVGRAPKGERTNWVMHEYRLEEDGSARAETAQDAFVVCRVFQKRGPGPQNGAQYGAPFVEEDWEEDDVEPSICGSIPSNLIADSLLAEEDELKQGWSTHDQSGLPDTHRRMGFGDVIDNGQPTHEKDALALLNDEFLEFNDFISSSPVHATNTEQTKPSTIDNHVGLFEDEPGFSEFFADESSFLEINDLLGDELGHNQPVTKAKADDEATFFPGNDPNFLDSLVSSSGGPDMVDELLAYFNATENVKPSELIGFDAGTSDSSAMRVNQSDLYPRRGSMHNWESTHSLAMGFADEPGRAKGGFSARLVRMLGAISSPPALAAEKNHSTSSGKDAPSAFSPGPIHIASATVVPEKIVTDDDRRFFLAYGSDGNEFEKLGKATSGLLAFIQHNSFHLGFLSVLLVAASFKICVCAFAR